VLYQRDSTLHDAISNIKQSDSIDDRFKRLTYLVKQFESNYINQEIEKLSDIYYAATGKEIDKPTDFEQCSSHLKSLHENIKAGFIQKIESKKSFLLWKESNYRTYSHEQLYLLSTRIEARNILQDIGQGTKQQQLAKAQEILINDIQDQQRLIDIAFSLAGKKADIEMMLRDPDYKILSDITKF
jgi:hypothetical protein